MSCILNIETATEVCSVAVSKDGNLLFEKESLEGPSHASLLGVFVSEAIDFIRRENFILDAVAVSCGPGSYTGLRIGVSEAKGLCYGFGIPLIAIKTPHVLTAKLLQTKDVKEDVLLCPMIDARRMEVYAAIYDKELRLVRDIAADIVDENTYSEFLVSSSILFFGNGAMKCEKAINSSKASFIDGIFPSASSMISLSEKAYLDKDFVDLAYFEPFYLKDFVATKPKKNLLL